MSQFARALVAWQARHGRKGLPWQGTRDPYRVWLSEIMLQQTQVAAVIPYYERFLRRFPTVEKLARAKEGEVLRLWSGLGYYARARNLHQAAKQIVSRGAFPRTAAGIAELQGVGRSTAAAIAAFAFGERAAILDGNVKRVLARYFGVDGWPGEKRVEQRLWALAETLLPARGIETYTQAVMDLGATLCTKNPQCGRCPVRAQCAARREGRAAELPQPRPRKALPVKTVRWHVCLRGRKVLLERRPSAGIWGGLLAFPEQGNYVVLGRLPVIEHGFTHFKLRARPVLCRGEAGANQVWMDRRAAMRAAVPAPVRTLLARLPEAS